jgi:hypothetical protein
LNYEWLKKRVKLEKWNIVKQCVLLEVDRTVGQSHDAVSELLPQFLNHMDQQQQASPFLERKKII